MQALLKYMEVKLVGKTIQFSFNWIEGKAENSSHTKKGHNAPTEIERSKRNMSSRLAIRRNGFNHAGRFLTTFCTKTCFNSHH